MEPYSTPAGTLTWEVMIDPVLKAIYFYHRFFAILITKVLHIYFKYIFVILSVPTQRGDIEVLCYNMILWLCGSLPWEKLVDKVTVQREKGKAFENINDFLHKCFQGSVPQAVYKFMTLLSNIKFNEAPRYDKFKDILVAGLKTIDHKPDGKLGLKSTRQQNSTKSTPLKVKKPVGRVQRSPPSKPVVAATSSLRFNPRDSTIGIVIDKKRGNKKDIKQVLEDIDPDGEYDIKIVRKTKKLESVDEEVPKATKSETLLSTRKKIRVNYMDDDSEDDLTTEVI